MSEAQSAPNRRKKGRPLRNVADRAGGPDFSRETRLAARPGAAGRVVGVDEVGRGPLAGPVLAACAWLSPAAAARMATLGLDDSKKLSARRRAELHGALSDLQTEGEAAFTLAAASLAEIERLNILWASHLAMRRAVERMARRLGAPPGHALIDGNKIPDGLPCPAEAIVGGDGAALSIAAAALAAKQARDRLMGRLAVRYPGYGWETNAGYGARAHRAAILSRGLTPHHRRGFCRRLLESATAREEWDGPGQDDG